MAHAAWIGDLTAAQRDTAFGTGEGRLGFSVLRIPVPENQADWSRDLATARRAVELGAIVFASPWNPPASMIETFTRGTQTNAKRLRYNAYAAYAQHLNDFTTHMRNNGVNLYAISVQNEPDYAHDWTWWTSAEMLRFLRENAGSISTRVIAPESFQYVKSVSDPILNDATALANVDILGAHLYGTSYSNFPYPLFKQRGAGKELWMTEVYYPNSSDSADLWPQALDVGEHIHRAMVDAEFQTYVWWYIRRGYGPMREDGQISKRGAMMAHFARFVRPGYVRIDATANPASNVYVSAYRSGETDRHRRRQQEHLRREPAVLPVRQRRDRRHVVADRREPDRRPAGDRRHVQRLPHRHPPGPERDDLRDQRGPPPLADPRRPLPRRRPPRRPAAAPGSSGWRTR